MPATLPPRRSAALPDSGPLATVPRLPLCPAEREDQLAAPLVVDRYRQLHRLEGTLEVCHGLLPGEELERRFARAHAVVEGALDVATGRRLEELAGELGEMRPGALAAQRPDAAPTC